MRIPTFAVLLPLAAAACAPTAAETAAGADRKAAVENKLARELAGLVPGEPTSCLPFSGASRYQTTAYGKTILYKYSRGLIYRTDTQGGCEGIARGNALITRQTGPQLCQGDIAQTVDLVARFPTGSCSFGPFIPYRKP